MARQDRGDRVGSVTERDDEEADRPAAGPGPDDEPEPDWAAEIHRRRRAYGDRLRRIFAAFDEEQEER